MLNRDSSANAPVRKLVTDITVVSCTDGLLYLSAVMDLYNNEILVHRFSMSLDTVLVTTTINDVAARYDVSGVLLHSDKDPTYRSFDYQSLLVTLGIVPSLSRAGNCWDNAAMESFFGHLKCELGYASRMSKKPSSKKAIEVIDRYIVFYNERRIQHGLGYGSPIAFRTEKALPGGK